MILAEKKFKDATVYVDEKTFEFFNQKSLPIKRIMPMTYLLNTQDIKNIFDENIIEYVYEYDKPSETGTVIGKLNKYKFAQSYNVNLLANAVLDTINEQMDSIDENTFIQSIKDTIKNNILQELFAKENVIHQDLQLKGFGYIEYNDTILTTFEKISFEEEKIVLSNVISDISIKSIDKAVINFIPNQKRYPGRYIILDDIASYTSRNHIIDCKAAINLSKKINVPVYVERKQEEDFFTYSKRFLQELEEDRNSDTFELDIDL